MEKSEQSFDSEKQRESLLARIDNPQDLKSLSIEELYQLAEEIRDEIVCTVSQTGGHLAPNLGAVELTLALHFGYFGFKFSCHASILPLLDRLGSLRSLGSL